jgi:Peptidase A4 family
MSDQQMIRPNETFISKGDRPQVRSTQDNSQDARAPFYKVNEKWSRELQRQNHKEKSFEELFELVLKLKYSEPVIYSNNWSGAVAIQEKGSTGQPKIKSARFHSVWATWTVPAVKPPQNASAGEWRSASWVGLDGGSFDQGASKDVLQAGIDQNVTKDGTGKIDEKYYAWCTWDLGDGSGVQILDDFPVKRGDLIHLRVEYLQGIDKGVGLAHLYNYTQKLEASRLIPKPAGLKEFVGDSAEWIVERPFDHASKKFYNLADFGVMAFFNAGALTADDALLTPEDGFLCAMGSTDEKRIISEPDECNSNVRITWKYPS